MSKIKKSKFVLTSDLVDLESSAKNKQSLSEPKFVINKKEIDLEKNPEMKKEQLNIRIKSSLKKMFQVWCIHNNKQMAEVVEEMIKNNNEIIALPQPVSDALAILQSALYIKKAGVFLGTVIKNELVPAHDLALSIQINPAVPFVAVTKAIALQYLRREEIHLESVQKGWILLKYENLPLGWVKILTNRINNYYPTLWRILKK